MTVRVGERIVAGGGAVKDNLTIINNADEQIQAVGKINQNFANVSAPVLYDWVGTIQEYQDQNIELEHPTWICFITDDDGTDESSCLTLLEFKWFDRNPNDTRWLCADNFTWQDGNIYQAAYLHLFSDLYEDDVTLYSWASSSTTKVIYTKTETPAVNSWTYDDQGRQWKTISTVSGNQIDVLNAPSGEGGPYVRNVAGDMTITAHLGVQHTETISGTTITYYTAPDGHKICMPDQENAVQTIYNDTGAAWFYILDSTNTRFKLPRINPEVHYPEAEMYLYFYVGEFSSSALKNTAGITTEELNAKADVSMFQVVSALPANPDINTFYFVIG